jgi:hypothetical protein
MYHPSGDGLAEFIELLNISSSVTLNLQGVRFTKGVDLISPAAPSLRYPLADVCSSCATSPLSIPFTAPIFRRSVFTNGTALSNSGDLMKLEDANHEIISEFAYSDQAPWPTAADAGYSLVLIAPETKPNPALAMNWRASFQCGGSPGGRMFPVSGRSDGRREWKWRSVTLSITGWVMISGCLLFFPSWFGSQTRLAKGSCFNWFTRSVSLRQTSRSAFPFPQI